VWAAPEASGPRTGGPSSARLATSATVQASSRRSPMVVSPTTAACTRIKIAWSHAHAHHAGGQPDDERMHACMHEWAKGGSENGYTKLQNNGQLPTCRAGLPLAVHARCVRLVRWKRSTTRNGPRRPSTAAATACARPRPPCCPPVASGPPVGCPPVARGPTSGCSPRQAVPGGPPPSAGTLPAPPPPPNTSRTRSVSMLSGGRGGCPGLSISCPASSPNTACTR
jgi:hypothetical protein